MCKRSAPPWATLFFGIKESGLCSNKGFLKKFEDNLLFYKRYLDDILAIWLAHPNPAKMQNCGRISKTRSMISTGWNGRLQSPQKQM